MLTYLIHLGYLGYNEDNETAFVPNEEIRQELITAVRSSNRDEALAYGIINGDVAYLAVFTPAADEVKIPLTFEKEIVEVSVIYPKEQLCEYSYENGVLHVKMPQKAAARLFRIQLK